MHPLLSPQTHADLEILARELTLSNYYDGDDAYLKMFLGITLGLTALESLKGITIEKDTVIVEHFRLIERAVKRAGYKVDVVVSDKACEATVQYNGRLVGKAEYPSDKNAAGRSFRSAYVGVCREFLTDVFGHRFKMRDEMPSKAKQLASKVGQKTGLSVSTADTAPAPKPKPPTTVDTSDDAFVSNLSVSNRSALISWQNGIDELNPDRPGEWDAHRFRLGQMTFLKEAEMIDLFERFAVRALEFGLGYNTTERRFYIIEEEIIGDLQA